MPRPQTRPRCTACNRAHPAPNKKVKLSPEKAQKLEARVAKRAEALAAQMAKLEQLQKRLQNAEVSSAAVAA